MADLLLLDVAPLSLFINPAGKSLKPKLAGAQAAILGGEKHEKVANMLLLAHY